jgi:hypothetical protein
MDLLSLICCFACPCIGLPNILLSWLLGYTEISICSNICSNIDIFSNICSGWSIF